jgi:hypothetical protein
MKQPTRTALVALATSALLAGTAVIGYDYLQSDQRNTGENDLSASEATGSADEGSTTDLKANGGKEGTLPDTSGEDIENGSTAVTTPIHTALTDLGLSVPMAEWEFSAIADDAGIQVVVTRLNGQPQSISGASTGPRVGVAVENGLVVRVAFVERLETLDEPLTEVDGAPTFRESIIGRIMDDAPDQFTAADADCVANEISDNATPDDLEGLLSYIETGDSGPINGLLSTAALTCVGADGLLQLITSGMGATPEQAACISAALDLDAEELFGLLMADESEDIAEEQFAVAMAFLAAAIECGVNESSDADAGGSNEAGAETGGSAGEDFSASPEQPEIAEPAPSTGSTITVNGVIWSESARAPICPDGAPCDCVDLDGCTDGDDHWGRYEDQTEREWYTPFCTSDSSRQAEILGGPFCVNPFEVKNTSPTCPNGAPCVCMDEDGDCGDGDDMWGWDNGGSLDFFCTNDFRSWARTFGGIMCVEA